MRILLANDDGVHAPGLQTLRKTLEKIAEVIVVAPLEERSTTGHTLTLDSPLRLVEIEKNVYGCSGYPADCTLMGLAHILKDNKPDLVVSGINRGANLGQDIFYSGTVAAAREACFRHTPAIAVSSVVDFIQPRPKSADEELFQTAADFICEILQSNCLSYFSGKELLNVNVPNLTREDLKGAQMTTLGFRNYSEDILERRDFRDRKYYWIGGVYKGFEMVHNSDCHVVDEGKISITCLDLNSHNSNQEADPKRWMPFFERFKNWK